MHCDTNSSPEVSGSDGGTSHNRGNLLGKSPHRSDDTNGSAAKAKMTTPPSLEQMRMHSSSSSTHRDADSHLSSMYGFSQQPASLELCQSSQLDSSKGPDERSQQYVCSAALSHPTSTSADTAGKRHGHSFMRHLPSGKVLNNEPHASLGMASQVSSSRDVTTSMDYQPWQPKDTSMKSSVSGVDDQNECKSSSILGTSAEKCDVSSVRGTIGRSKSMDEKHDCQVCGDVAAGFHCGAYVCEACKKFFVRCLKQDSGERFVCSRKSACAITRETRTQCQRCRFNKCVSLGMYKPGTWPGGDVDTNISGIPCKVCGGASTGYHFGAITCEGCKGFFRRTVKERDGLKYVCTRDGDCNITMATRNICKFCRYKKCLSVGMTPDGSRIGRQPNSIKHARMLEIKNLHAKGELIPKPVIIKQEIPDTEDLVKDPAGLAEKSAQDESTSSGAGDASVLERLPDWDFEYNSDQRTLLPLMEVSTRTPSPEIVDANVASSCVIGAKDGLEQLDHSRDWSSNLPANVAHQAPVPTPPDVADLHGPRLSLHTASHIPTQTSNTYTMPRSLGLSPVSRTLSEMPTRTPASHARFDRSTPSSSPQAIAHMPLPVSYSNLAYRTPLLAPLDHLSLHMPMPTLLTASHMLPSSPHLIDDNRELSQSASPMVDSGQQRNVVSPTTETTLIHQLNGKLQVNWTKPSQKKNRSDQTFHHTMAANSQWHLPHSDDSPNLPTFVSQIPVGMPHSTSLQLDRPATLIHSRAEASHPIAHSSMKCSGHSAGSQPHSLPQDLLQAQVGSLTSHGRSCFKPAASNDWSSEMSKATATPLGFPHPALDRREHHTTPPTSKFDEDKDIARKSYHSGSTHIPVNTGTSAKISDASGKKVDDVTPPSPRKHCSPVKAEDEAKACESPQGEAQAVSDDAQSYVPDTPLDFSPKEMIESVCKAYKYLDPINSRSPDCPVLAENSSLSEAWTTMMNQFTQCAHATLKFAKNVPGFRKFPIEMQIEKVQGSMYPIVLSILSVNFDIDRMAYNYFNMSAIEENKILTVLPAFRPIQTHLMDFGRQIKQNNITDPELALLCALNLSSASQMLENDLQHRLVLALEAYCEETYCDSAARQTMLLDFLSQLQQANRDHTMSVIQVKMNHPDLEIPQLFHETFLSE